MVSSIDITWELVRTAESADPVSDLLSILRSPADFMCMLVWEALLHDLLIPLHMYTLKQWFPSLLAPDGFRGRQFFHILAWRVVSGWFRHITFIKESTCNVRNLSLTPGSGRSPAEVNSYSLQCSYLENYMDRGAWWATARGVAKNRMWLSN